MGFGANSAWRKRGGGVEDSDVELRRDDNALRSAFLGDSGVVMKEDMMDRVQKAGGEVGLRHHFSRAKYLLVFNRSETVSFIVH
jgi:hypothetical protein